jgi:hypothetical protein
MAGTDSRSRALREALDEHHKLLELQNRLTGRFADGSCPAFNDWIVHVREEIAEMTDLLEGHFRLEEADGLHDEIVSLLPNATSKLAHLLAEHARILDRARSLRATATATIQPGGDGPLRNEASDFFALLDAHERTERELFLLAIEGDGGSPD